MKTLFLGDVCPTKVTGELFAKKDMKTLFSDTVSLFCGNDFNFVIFNFPLLKVAKLLKNTGRI